MEAQQPGPWRVILFTDLLEGVVGWQAILPAYKHRLVAVVTSPKRNPDYPRLVAAVSPGVDILVSDRRKRWAAMLAPLQPDLIISTSFPWLLPPDLLALPRLGAINFHGSALPQYRGTDTIQQTLRNGERELGMTIHRTVGAFDTGGILARGAVQIEDDDDLETLMARMVAQSPSLLDEVFSRVARGDPGEPQDEAQARYYGKIPDEAAWKTIDWTQPARKVHNVVRSSGFPRALPPGAVGDLDGVPHRITKTRLLPDSKGDGLPGSVVARDGEMLLVQCGDGLIGVVGYEAMTVG